MVIDDNGAGGQCPSSALLRGMIWWVPPRRLSGGCFVVTWGVFASAEGEAEAGAVSKAAVEPAANGAANGAADALAAGTGGGGSAARRVQAARLSATPAARPKALAGAGF